VKTIDLPDIDRVYIERHADNNHACDVIVKTSDGTVYTCLFVTLNYLRRQMEINYLFCKQVEDSVPVRFAALDTPHLLVEKLDRDTIEDTIDNLLALDIFETLFTRVTEREGDPTVKATRDAGRTTQEVAAVVISDVLVVSG
jgi:hypothetical protein